MGEETLEPERLRTGEFLVRVDAGDYSCAFALALALALTVAVAVAVADADGTLNTSHSGTAEDLLRQEGIELLGPRANLVLQRITRD